MMYKLLLALFAIYMMGASSGSSFAGQGCSIGAEIEDPPECKSSYCPEMYLTGCSIKIKPDFAVIKAGIVAKNREIMESAVSSLEEYMKEKGKIVELSNLVMEHTRSFNLVVPFDSDIDQIMEDVSELGVNKFGLSRNRSRGCVNAQGFDPVVLYQVDNLEEKLNRFLNECKSRAWANWCRANTDNNYASDCSLSFGEVNKRMHVTYLSLSTKQTIMYGCRLVNFIQYPWEPSYLENLSFAEGAELELIGDVMTKLAPSGN